MTSCNYCVKMSLNRVRLLFKASSTLLHPLRSRHIGIIPNFAQQFKHCCTGTVSEPHVLPNKADVQMKIHFTCTICDTRNEKNFSKIAYTRGVVVIRCDGCSCNHLIADNLKWFNSEKKNIEDILAEKGLKVEKKVVDCKNSENTNEPAKQEVVAFPALSKISPDQK